MNKLSDFLFALVAHFFKISSHYYGKRLNALPLYIGYFVNTAYSWRISAMSTRKKR